MTKDIKEGKEIKEIIIKYTDGTEKALEEGIVLTHKCTEEDMTLSMDMLNMTASMITKYFDTIVLGYSELMEYKPFAKE